MTVQQKSEPILTPRRKDMVEIANTWPQCGPNNNLMLESSLQVDMYDSLVTS